MVSLLLMQAPYDVEEVLSEDRTTSIERDYVLAGPSKKALQIGSRAVVGSALYNFPLLEEKVDVVGPLEGSSAKQSSDEVVFVFYI
jgi:hypothetical protein